MNSHLKIPTNKRSAFAEPLDVLIAGSREDTLAQVEDIFKELKKSKVNFNFFIVGDVVTADFMSNPFLKNYVKLCIIDEKTKRKQLIANFSSFFEKVVEFKNSTGTIHKDSWNMLKDVIRSKKKTLVKITEGEEDLLVIPLVLQLPIEIGVKNYVFYGQPPITDSEFTIPEGIVVVDVDEGIQKKVKTLLSLMEKC